MKKIIPKILLVLLILVIIAFGIKTYLEGKTKFNNSPVNGNTIGNLYNAGLFCEKDGKIYFSNPDDNGCLYVMDADQSNLQKLNADSVMYINVDDNYIYYVRNNDAKKSSSEYPYFSFNNNSLCRTDLEGKNVKILDENPCIYAALTGNYIYYLHYDTEDATTLYKVKIDGTEKKQVLSYYVFNCSMVGSTFYYSGTGDNGDLYRYDTLTDSHTDIYPCTCYKPVAQDDSNFFYMDYDKNNKLVHLNTEFQTENILSDDSVDLFNLYGSTIYYQKYSQENPAICKIKTDGSEPETLALGNYKNINVTSHYVYFQNAITGETYYMSTNNPGAILTFHPGVQNKSK